MDYKPYLANFNALPVFVRIFLVTGLVLVFVLGFMWATNTIGSAEDTVHAWIYDRHDKEHVKQIEVKQKEIDALQENVVDTRKQADEWKLKYDLAIKAADAEHGNGEHLDAAIQDEYQKLQAVHDHPTVDDVDPDELLDRLRRHEADEAGRTQPKVRRSTP